MRVFFPIFLALWSGEGAHAQAPVTSQPLISDEDSILSLTNYFRQSLGLSELVPESHLAAAAKLASQTMAKSNHLSHFGPISTAFPFAILSAFDRIVDAGYGPYTIAGENISCGNSTPLEVFQSWAVSPEHLANLINPHYRQAGVAIANGTISQYIQSLQLHECAPIFWTMDFASHESFDFDPPEIVDLEQITEAVIQITGALPLGQTISLP